MEVCRRPSGRGAEAWADEVEAALPWSSVPGSGALDVEESVDDAAPVFAFFAVIALAAAALSATLLGGGGGVAPSDVDYYY